ncbi:alpha/beta-type small acid-soluble spore protein [Cohnella candidum]|uniref:Alpha/beta-type small acid-soluble spore protein n=1 Tax=Cohnella candidum TaxID=2674991 RepID=A0A3G3JTQ0_9BACL|nr:alpha/beta-type small acid-soluble spore protein [Cohnella candidum]AYQ71610.1 alpha/beta-type small acid-soluble spore protein [Cohnella candidum]
MSRRRSNRLVIPGAERALEMLKYEVAQELGITLSQDGYYGNLLTREAGAIGGNIVRRLVLIAEQQMANRI